MTYELTLKAADVPEPMLGEISLGVLHDGKEVAGINLNWSRTHFTGRFEDFAADMPVPAHPLAFLKAAADALNGAKVTADEPISSVFGRTTPTFNLASLT